VVNVFQNEMKTLCQKNCGKKANWK